VPFQAIDKNSQQAKPQQTGKPFDLKNLKIHAVKYLLVGTSVPSHHLQKSIYADWSEGLHVLFATLFSSSYEKGYLCYRLL
jgi:hypothetical protein